jgi:hypothetical protein
MHRQLEDQVGVLESKISLNAFCKITEEIYATFEQVKQRANRQEDYC